MRNVRLLFFLSDPFPPFRADVASLFGKYLPDKGVGSDIVAIQHAIPDGISTWGGGKAFLCTPSKYSAVSYIKKSLHCLGVMLKANRHHYDAIQVRDMPYVALMCMVLARFKRMPFYYWMSYPVPEGQIIRAKEGLAKSFRLKSLLLLMIGHINKRILKWLIIPNVDHLFVQSPQMKRDVLRGSNISEKKITPVCMGVDVDLIKKSKLAAIDSPFFADRKVIVYLGTLDKVRQIEILFEMLILVRQNIKNAVLVLIGDTKDSTHREWLKAQAIKHHVQDHVLWTGWMAMNDAWRYVLAGDVAVSPFPRGVMLDSASPTKVPEYMALGIPVVCNDNPDQKQAVEMSGAGICVEYTAEQFAASVQLILDEGREKREQRIQQGCEFVKNNRDYAVISLNLAEKYIRLSNMYRCL